LITPKRQLTLFDSTCLIVGIIVGAGVYQVGPDVARGTGSGWAFLAIWLAGGLLSLFGAFGYAELASALPQEGGDYVFLTRAYGPWAGFLFGWIQTVIVRPGDIAIMAFAFATYAQAGIPGLASIPAGTQLTAGVAVVVLTGINILGVRESKWTQNLLTVAKVIGLLLVIAVAAIASREGLPEMEGESLPLSLALILVLFTFGGWNEMVYVAAEVKDPQRNIVRALVGGTLAVTVLYLLTNGAFLYALGIDGIAGSNAVAADAVVSVFPNAGAAMISVLVCVSALGAVNGLIFAGARISYATGADHRIFRPLGRWNPKTGTPVRALVVQGAISLLLIAILGSFMNTILYTAAAVYAFYLATSLAVVVLRIREPQLPRSYRTWGYPFTTIIFAGVCGFLIYSAVIYKPEISADCCLLILLGLPLYWISSRTR